MTDRERAIAAEIRRLAREELSIAADPPPGAELASQLDSLALLSLVVAVEDRFRIRTASTTALAAPNASAVRHEPYTSGIAASSRTTAR